MREQYNDLDSNESKVIWPARIQGNIELHQTLLRAKGNGKLRLIAEPGSKIILNECRICIHPGDYCRIHITQGDFSLHLFRFDSAHRPLRINYRGPASELEWYLLDAGLELHELTGEIPNNAPPPRMLSLPNRHDDKRIRLPHAQPSFKFDLATAHQM